MVIGGRPGTDREKTPAEGEIGRDFTRLISLARDASAPLTGVAARTCRNGTRELLLRGRPRNRSVDWKPLTTTDN